MRSPYGLLMQPLNHFSVAKFIVAGYQALCGISIGALVVENFDSPRISRANLQNRPSNVHAVLNALQHYLSYLLGSDPRVLGIIHVDQLFWMLHP